MGLGNKNDGSTVGWLVITVLETLFDTIALNDDYSIKYSSNLKSNGSFEQHV